MIYDSDMETKLELGRRVKNKRLELNLRMNDVAKEVGIARATLWSIENGKGNYSIDSLIKLLGLLDLSFEIGSTEDIPSRKRATRAVSLLDKKVNRFIVMCVEQYASFVQKSSRSVFKALNEKGIIKELEGDYEDMHGMSVDEINEYIAKKLSKGAE